MKDLESSLIKEAVIYGGSRLLVILIPLIMLPIVTRYLTPNDLGQYAAIMAFCSWVMILVGFGGTGPLTRYMSLTLEPEEKKIITSSWVWGMVLTTGIVLSAAWLGRGFIAASFLNDAVLCLPFFLALVAAFGSFITDMFAQILRFDLKATHFSVLQITRGVSTALFSIFLLIKGYQLLGLIIGGLIGALVLLPIYIFFTRDYLRLYINLPMLKKMILFGAPLVPATAMWTGLTMVDRLMLVRYASNADAGLYATAVNLTAPIVLLYAAFGTAWSPRAFQIYKENSQLAPHLYGRVLYIFVYVMVLVSIPLAAFAKDVLMLLTPESYWPAGVVVGLLCVAAISDGSTYITQLGFSIKEKTKYMIIPPIIALLVNVVINYLLIPRWGYIGAAIASALSYAGLSLSYYAIGNKVFPIWVDRKIVFTMICFVLSIGGLGYLSSLENHFLLVRMLVLLISGVILYFLAPIRFQQLKVNYRNWILNRNIKDAQLRS
jgi:O-antigen/teichoic acid export membrane protein